MRENMKKLIPIVIVGILVLSGLGAAAFTPNVSLKQATKITDDSASIAFSSSPIISEKDGFIDIQIDGATTQLLDFNKPLLPVYIKTLQIPYGSTDIQVVCIPQNTNTMFLTKEIAPARIAPTGSEQIEYVTDPVVYGSYELYPSTWYTYELGS
jgi:hypothetical protein